MTDPLDPVDQWLDEDAHALVGDDLTFTRRVLGALPAKPRGARALQSRLLLGAYALLALWLCAVWPVLEPAWQQGGEAALGPGLVLTVSVALLLWWATPSGARR